ncbi:aldo/keto reductase [Natronoglycomyces albus]|uniref:Aldo/keto reductase n=1 Tax=Natronoglycomyces albus TaxID=2811108 RepID=A0A895XMN8_9ACTN|nr:aldo/keto reductase [Natronoglycomyces albus]QSB04285.1 aldo/keto reductase [Natronoglycomyces albus]
MAPVVCVQNAYGIGATQRMHAFVDECGRQGIAFVPYFAIAREGTEGGNSGRYEQKLVTMAQKYAVIPAQIRLAWTLVRGPHILAIPGTGNTTHLEENITAGTLRLDESDVNSLTSDE